MPTKEDIDQVIDALTINIRALTGLKGTEDAIREFERQITILLIKRKELYPNET
jgi:hypothetical protein